MSRINWRAVISLVVGVARAVYAWVARRRRPPSPPAPLPPAPAPALPGGPPAAA